MISVAHWVLHLNASRGRTGVDRRDDGEMSPQGLHLTPSQYPKGRGRMAITLFGNPIVCLWKMIG